MPQYLVCNYLPDDFDPSTVTEAMIEEIHALNRELIAAGALIYPVPFVVFQTREHLCCWHSFGGRAATRENFASCWDMAISP